MDIPRISPTPPFLFIYLFFAAFIWTGDGANSQNSRIFARQIAFVNVNVLCMTVWRYLATGFYYIGREFPPMEDRRTVGEHWNIFRQHHRGIVRMKFSRSGSNPPSHPWDKKGTRFVYEAKLSKGGQGM